MSFDVNLETAKRQQTKWTGHAKPVFSRFSVSRWLKGETEIRLPDFFHLVDVISAQLLQFIACFVDPQDLPSLRFAWKQRQAAQQMMNRHLPWTHVVLLALETESYLQLVTHRPGWIANYLNVSEDIEVECLDILQATGQIQWIKIHCRCVTVQTIDTQVVPGAGRKLKAWSTQQGYQ